MASDRVLFSQSLKYPVQITPVAEEDGGGYMAIIPQLGSWTFVGDGETPEEALASLNAIKAELFEEMLERGLPIPEPEPEPEEDAEASSTRFDLRIPRELHRQLVYQAVANGISLDVYVTNLLSARTAGL
jgi:predicted RNase H-like HicB family nuclease